MKNPFEANYRRGLWPRAC